MSLYRRTRGIRPRTLAAALVAALVAGAGAGYAIGRSSAGEPTGAALAARLSTALRPVANGLEILPTEYPQAYAGSGNEGAAVRGALGRLRAGFDAARGDLRALEPAGERALGRRIAALEAAVAAKARPSEVARLTAQARQALAEVPGGR
jgi:hypothetical protein